MNNQDIVEYLEDIQARRNEAIQREFEYKGKFEAMMESRNIIQRDLYAMRDERDKLQTDRDQAISREFDYKERWRGMMGDLGLMRTERDEMYAKLQQATTLDAQHWKNIAQDWDVKLQGAMEELRHVEGERDQWMGDAERWKRIAEEHREEPEKRPPKFLELSKLLREAVEERDGWMLECQLTNRDLRKELERRLDLAHAESERDGWKLVAENHAKELSRLDRSPAPFTVKVVRCARCQGTHDLVFAQLENSTPPGLLWAMCPVTHSPIMLEQRGD